MNCKYCKKEIPEIKFNNKLGEFCSEKCFWDWDDVSGVGLVEYSETNLIGKNWDGNKKKPKQDIAFLFENVIRKTGMFVISQITLDNIYNSDKSIQFKKFLVDNGCVIQNFNFSEHSIIKKVR